MDALAPELRRPRDGSDLATLHDATSELARLKALFAGPLGQSIG